MLIHAFIGSSESEKTPETIKRLKEHLRTQPITHDTTAVIHGSAIRENHRFLNHGILGFSRLKTHEIDIDMTSLPTRSGTTSQHASIPITILGSPKGEGWKSAAVPIAR